MLGWFKTAKFALILLLAAVAGALVLPTGLRLARRIDLALRFDSRSRLAVSVLRSEAMRFLVTRRLCSTVVLEKDENSLLLGERRGWLFGDVSLLYGFDLNKLDPAAVRRDGDAIVIRLPEPELLDTVVDLDTLRTVTRQSGLSLIADKLNNRSLRDELRREFSAAARDHFARRGLLPDRAAMRDELNRWAAPLFTARSLNVRFE